MRYGEEFWRGYKAYKKGYLSSEAPYKNKLKDGDWLDGWNAAEDDEDENFWEEAKSS